VRPPGQLARRIKATPSQNASPKDCCAEGWTRSALPQVTLDLGAIGRRNAVHPLGCMAGIVAQNGAAGVAAAKLSGLAEILHAEADVGLGIVEALGAARIAHHPCRGRLDLHQADLTCP